MKQQSIINEHQAEQIITQLWRKPDTQKKGTASTKNNSGAPIVYAILDGSRNKKIYPLLKNSKQKFSCLYEGDLNYELTLAAPYIVRLDKDSEFTRELLIQAWGNSWGIFAVTYAPATLISVRRNCRKSAYVLDENKRKLLFRYYDPRVLRTYLPGCSNDESAKFFGPVSEFLVESKNKKKLHRFRQTENGVIDINEALNSSQKEIFDIPISNNLDAKGMLIISSKQMSDFEKIKLESFMLQMQRHLIASFDRSFTVLGNKQEQFFWVRKNTLKAMSLGFNNEQEICRYLNVAVLQGENFDVTPWATKILNSQYQPTTKAMQLEAASIEILKAEKKSILDELNADKERLLKSFYESQKFKTKNIGQALFGLDFQSEAELKDWLYKVGNNSFKYSLYEKMEMDLWLDLSMRYGIDFYEQDWAKHHLQTDLTAQEKLSYLLNNQPITTESELS